MKVLIINCFDTYEERVNLIYDFFYNRGEDTKIIESDFKHLKKTKHNLCKKNFIFIETKPYYKNISLTRIISHYDFSKKTFKLVESLKPDLLYVMIPPNYLAKFASQYKKKHCSVKLILDLMDLWPETMPFEKIKKLPLFRFWGNMRNKSLKYADHIITECDLYQEVLKRHLKNINVSTLYLAKKNVEVSRKMYLKKNEIHLCYLGSINNIIDINKIKKIVSRISQIKRTIIHIIGDGENRETLISEIEDTGAIVEYHGEIYKQQDKQCIFDKCYFGLNIMKNNVCVGLTMKSIDYFHGGLPILNSIQFDTAKIVSRYNIGINITNENIEFIANEVVNLNIEDVLVMKDNTRRVFEKLFSVQSFNEKLNDCMTES